MKRIPILLILCSISLIQYGQIIADHTVVDKFDEIPQYYIDKVKAMWLSYAGESHSGAIRAGLLALEALEPKYAVSVIESGTPTAITATNLRASRATWGDWDTPTGWIYTYGEEDWYTSLAAISQTKKSIEYCNNSGLGLSAFGFGWCWDPVGWTPTANADPIYDVHWTGASNNGPEGSRHWGLDLEDYILTGNTVCMDTYLNATQEYIDFCRTKGYDTKVFFTTGPVDGYTTGELRWEKQVKYDHIRKYVLEDNSRILFDYADILCYDNNNIPTTGTWNEHTYYSISPSNLTPIIDDYHISVAGAVRLAKAMWWMLARMAGWDGGTSIAPGTWLGMTTDWNNLSNWPVEIPSITTDVIISSSVSNQPFVFSSPMAICKNLTLDVNATLTINAGQAITVSGNMVNNGNIIIESTGVNSSGSLIANSASGTGTVTYHRSLREGDNYGDKHLFSSPVGGQVVSGFISVYNNKIDAVRIWDEINAVWSPVTSGEFTSGKGYNVYQTDVSDGGFSFTGLVVSSATMYATSPYAESYEVRLAKYPENPYGNTNPDQIVWATPRSWTNWGGGGWNLLGNPFTSAMSAKAFIDRNLTDFDPFYQALYVYDGTYGRYLYAGKAVPGFEEDGLFGENIQAGQGFMVMVNNNGVWFDFDKSMQIHGTGVTLLKSANAEDPWPGLQLKVSFGDKERATTIVYHSEMTRGLDPGYDVGQLSTGPAVEIYTALAEKDYAVNLSRQALPLDDADKIIVPVGIDSEKGGIVTFSAFIIPHDNNKFWLEDRKTGIFTDLNSYSYSATLPANTYGTGRFFIYASANTPTAVKTPREVPVIRVWAYNDKVIIKGSVSERATCEIYDLQGQKVLISRLTDGELNIVNLFSVSRGVYLVRVVDGMKVYTNKIALL